MVGGLYEWLVDKEVRGELVVDVRVGGVEVGMEYGGEGEMVVKIGGGGVGNVEVGNDEVGFKGGFGGIGGEVCVGVGGVVGM